MTERLRALVGQYDSGRLIERGNEIIAQGGIAGNVYDVIHRIKERKPERVVLCGEMLSICVRIATVALLDWEDENGEKQIKELIVDLSSSRGFGAVSDEEIHGGFNPTQEELHMRKMSLTMRLSSKIQNDPRLKIVFSYE